MLPFFKRKKKIEKVEEKGLKEPKEKAVKRVEKPQEKKEPEKKRSEAAPLKMAWRVLEETHITEKATDLIEKNQYVFKVFPKANKKEIKKAIEGLFSVDVLGVRIVNVPRKRRRLGRVRGWRKGYKKAIIKIKKGQKIEVLPR
jgi:large subunit ribosomal protein L23